MQTGIFAKIKMWVWNITMALAVPLLMSAVVMADVKIRAVAANRVAMFISIDGLIKKQLSEDNLPDSMDGIIAQAPADAFKRVFPEGLSYHRNSLSSYSLQEKESRMISLFGWDRLISTEAEKPKYEKAGPVSK